MSGHTPGPWLVQQEGDGTWTVWTRQPHIGELAFVQDEDINGSFPAEANARAMAAAPDMLEALKWIRKSLGWQYIPTETRSMVREAIAKAEGK